jgi:hypothetical protein
LIRDVTEEKQVERKLGEAERLAALGVIAAGIGHEINNPLMVVQQNTGLVAERLASLARRFAGVGGRVVRNSGTGKSASRSVPDLEHEQVAEVDPGVLAAGRRIEVVGYGELAACRCLAEVHPALGRQPLFDASGRVVGEDLVPACLEGVECRADHVLGLHLRPGIIARHVCVDVPGVHREHLRFLSLELSSRP